MHQAIHSLFDSDIYVAINFFVDKVTFVYDILGNDFERCLIIYGLLRWIVQVDVLEIYNKAFSIWYGEDAVKIEFVRV